MRPHSFTALPVLAALALLATGGMASAGDIYCTAQQTKDCRDRPTPGAEIVRVQPAPGQSAASQPATGGGQATTTRPAAAPDAAANGRLQAAARAAAVQKDVGAIRAEQCKKATEKYQQSIEARRMYRVGKDGEREYFSDAEVDAARLSLRTEVDQACGKGG